MSSTYYSDENGWAYYADHNGQSQYLIDRAGNYVRYAEVTTSASAPRLDSGRSDGSRHSSSSKNSQGSRHSRSSNNSEDSKHSSSSKNSKCSDADSGVSSNTPAMVGWQCHWCETTNYTDHLMIPFMIPLRDADGNVFLDQRGEPVYHEYPYIPCAGCNGACNPSCAPLSDPQ
ncbi:hypothetical protein QQS21_012447 [Conoideocrella luteorostrata]|uniref:Uncharacterized protein n=1 Tax=Conoideocrella luteorostrata TaxID=1105319 RepID=A0AAJ0FMN1_9HYPO|nr:hypothetical protein QQS21_012447 [Conoideocrella luteorostrata]